MSLDYERSVLVKKIFAKRNQGKMPVTKAHANVSVRCLDGWAGSETFLPPRPEKCFSPNKQNMDRVGMLFTAIATKRMETQYVQRINQSINQQRYFDVLSHPIAWSNAPNAVCVGENIACAVCVEKREDDDIVGSCVPYSSLT